MLADRGYRDRARALAARIREYDTFGAIEAELEEASLGRPCVWSRLSADRRARS